MTTSHVIQKVIVVCLAAILWAPAQGAQALTQTQDGTEFQQTLPFATTLTAVGEGGQASTGLPIPVGLTPLNLSGVITATAVSDGVAIISVGTNQTEVSVREGGAFSLSIPAGTMSDSVVVLDLVNKLDPLNDELCSYDTLTSVTLAEISISAFGEETPPATIAEFFSPAVRNITVLTTDAKDSAVNDAVLNAVGSLASKYGRDTIIVAMTEAEFTPTTTPGSRVVVIEKSSAAEVTAEVTAEVSTEVSNLTVPTLTLSGPATKLPPAAAALGSINLGLAGGPSATELQQTTSASTATTLTLADLGTANPVLAGVGRITYSTAISQSRFGGPVDSFKIHLEGGNTPTPKGGIVTASVLWNDVIVDSQSIASTDTYLVDVEIAASLVKRDNTLTVRLEAVPAGGYCTTGPLPAELTLNGKGSTVIARPGQGLPPGFERFPQTLGAALPVSFGSDEITPVMLTAAAHLVSTLQRASVPQLSIRVVDFTEFQAAAYPGLVVGATPADADALAAPLRFEPWRAVDAAGKSFTVSVEGPFAALEAFAPNGRDVLMLGSTEPASESAPLLNVLATDADADPFGWFVLTGDLLVAQGGQPNLALSSSTVVPQSTIAAEFTVPLWLIITVAVLFIIIVARLIAVSRRRRAIETDVER